jgi:hypothetical protein
MAGVAINAVSRLSTVGMQRVASSVGRPSLPARFPPVQTFEPAGPVPSQSFKTDKRSQFQRLADHRRIFRPCRIPILPLSPGAPSLKRLSMDQRRAQMVTYRSSWTALLGGAPQRVGTFEYRYDSDTWSWSDTVAKLRGYEPGTVEPSTELVLCHKHPDDVNQVKGLLKQSAAPFSSRERIRTTSGEERKVVVVGDAVFDDDGSVVPTRGFYTDVTEAVEAAGQGHAHDAVCNRRRRGVRRPPLAVTRLNVKLHTIAAKLVESMPGVLAPYGRKAADHYLMTLEIDGCLFAWPVVRRSTPARYGTLRGRASEVRILNAARAGPPEQASGFAADAKLTGNAASRLSKATQSGRTAETAQTSPAHSLSSPRRSEAGGPRR